VYASGERKFRTLQREDGIYNFSGKTLRGADFSGSYFFANFKNADLESAGFSECNVKTCDFSGAKLVFSTFYNSAIDAAIFDGADLREANFDESSACGHVFASGVRIPMMSATNSDLKSATYSNLKPAMVPI